MSQGDLSGMDSEVVEERVVAIDAVVASSKDGGVHGRRSGRPGEKGELFPIAASGALLQLYYKPALYKAWNDQ